MFDKRIINEILCGGSVRISVQCKDEHRLTDFQDWLTQFRETDCVSRRECVNCNTIRNTLGRLRLDVRIDKVPTGQREMLAGTLESIMLAKCEPANGPPLSIIRIE